MESIRDLTWVKQLHTGRVIERLALGGYRVVSLKTSSSKEHSADQYVYRMLFFPGSGHQPILALNLELSILGTACLTEQAGARHTRFETVEQELGYDAFRRWALARAEEALGLTLATGQPAS